MATTKAVEQVTFAAVGVAPVLPPGVIDAELIAASILMASADLFCGGSTVQVDRRAEQAWHCLGQLKDKRP